MAVFAIPSAKHLPIGATTPIPRQIQAGFARGCSSSLGNFVAGNASLTAASKAVDFGGSFVKMLLGDLLMDPFPPKPEAGGL
jgi:hypothetical protein